MFVPSPQPALTVRSVNNDILHPSNKVQKSAFAQYEKFDIQTQEVGKVEEKKKYIT